MGVNGYKEIVDQINHEKDLVMKEELRQQLEMMHQADDEKSRLFEDLIRGEWVTHDQLLNC